VFVVDMFVIPIADEKLRLREDNWVAQSYPSKEVFMTVTCAA
jgi:hypothetical protein